MLQDKVPGLVAAWAKTSDLDPADKKLRLKGLFEDESERAEELAAIFELYAGKFESMVASQVAQRVLKEVRPKLEEIVRDSIVVEVPPPVISMPETIAAPAQPGLEPPPEATEEDAETPQSSEAEDTGQPSEPESEPVDEPEPEEVVPEADSAKEEAPEAQPEEEVEPELDPVSDEDELEPEPEPAQEELDLDLEGQEKNEKDAPDELEEEKTDEKGVPGRISFDDIEGMIDNILGQTQ